MDFNKMIHTFKFLIPAMALVAMMLSPKKAGLKEELQKANEACKRGDCERWVDLIRPLAQKGQPYVQFGIGSVYADKDSVPHDDKIAFKWFLSSAEQGYAPSQLNVSLYYGSGRGVSFDIVEAYKWATLAARQGNKNAAKARDIQASLMTPAELAEAQRKVEEFKPK
jgi:hypothetical protein